MSDDSILIASGRLLNHFAKQGASAECIRAYPLSPPVCVFITT